MSFYNFKKRGVRTLIFKKKKFIFLEKNKIFKNVLINNKKNSHFLKFKFKVFLKKYQSISNQPNVCLKTGRYRSIINECKLKRQMFKVNIMKNKISFLKKKSII